MSDFFKFMMTVALRGSVTEPHEDVEDTNWSLWSTYYLQLLLHGVKTNKLFAWRWADNMTCCSHSLPFSRTN